MFSGTRKVQDYSSPRPRVTHRVRHRGLPQSQISWRDATDLTWGRCQKTHPAAGTCSYAARKLDGYLRQSLALALRLNRLRNGFYQPIMQSGQERPLPIDLADKSV